MVRKIKRERGFVPKALRDVWAWKEAIYRDVKHLPLDKALAAILDEAERISARAAPKLRRARRRKPNRA